MLAQPAWAAYAIGRPAKENGIARSAAERRNLVSPQYRFIRSCCPCKKRKDGAPSVWMAPRPMDYPARQKKLREHIAKAKTQTQTKIKSRFDALLISHLPNISISLWIHRKRGIPAG